MNKAMKNSIRIHWLALIVLFFILFLLFTNLSPFVSASACQENWACRDWKKCSDNLTARDCFDINNCGASYQILQIISNCSNIFKDCYDGVRDNDETDIDCGGSQCMPCSTGQYCLANEDCLTFYCPGSKCSTQTIEQPAIKITSPLLSYYLFFILATSLILFIIAINQINKALEVYPQNNLNSYLQKKVTNREKEIDDEIDLEASIPAKEAKKLQKEVIKIERKKKKEEKKELKKSREEKHEIGAELKKITKEEKEKLTKEKKEAILKGLKSAYEHSYE